MASENEPAKMLLPYLQRADKFQKQTPLSPITCHKEGFVQSVKAEVGEGCNIHGSLEVNIVVENFHFAIGKSFHKPSASLLLDLLALQTQNYNIDNPQD